MLNLNHNMIYKSKVLEILDDGSVILELPEELCEKMGWKEGTKIDISKNDDGEIILREIEQNVA